MEKNSGACPIT